MLTDAHKIIIEVELSDQRLLDSSLDQSDDD